MFRPIGLRAISCISFMLIEEEIKNVSQLLLYQVSLHILQLTVLHHAIQQNIDALLIVISINSRDRCLKQKVKYEFGIILGLQ